MPGTGKSSIARQLAAETGALWLRIDTIERAIRAAHPDIEIEDLGYRIDHGIAHDALCTGLPAIADCVNPWMLTRDAWRDIGVRSESPVIEVEIICSDVEEHRRRVETRTSDIPGARLPDWKSVMERDYRPWERERILIDTAKRPLAECVAELRARLP